MKTMYIKVVDAIPDKLGRQHFELKCHASNIGKGLNEEGFRVQYVFGNISEHINSFKERDYKIQYYI